MKNNPPAQTFHKLEQSTRINDILLGPLERPALKWLVHHLPAWVTPDHLTILGLVGSVMIFIGLAASRLHPAWLVLSSAGLVINWYGDSLDGTLARFRHIERPRYGFFIDRTADAVTVTLVFIGMGLSPFYRLDAALVALSGYLAMEVMVVSRTAATGVMRISYGKLGPTELRLAVIILNTLAGLGVQKIWEIGQLSFSVYDVVALVVGTLLWGIFCGQTLIALKELDQLEADVKARSLPHAHTPSSKHRARGGRITTNE